MRNCVEAASFLRVHRLRAHVLLLTRPSPQPGPSQLWGDWVWSGWGSHCALLLEMVAPSERASCHLAPAPGRTHPAWETENVQGNLTHKSRLAGGPTGPGGNSPPPRPWLASRLHPCVLGAHWRLLCFFLALPAAASLPVLTSLVCPGIKWFCWAPCHPLTFRGRGGLQVEAVHAKSLVQSRFHLSIWKESKLNRCSGIMCLPRHNWLLTD